MATIILNIVLGLDQNINADVEVPDQFLVQVVVLEEYTINGFTKEPEDWTVII